MNCPLLGVDIGFKRTGLALSESGMLARPLGVLEAKPPHMHKVVQELVETVRKYEIHTLVIGLPYNEEETPTSSSLKISQVIQQLEGALKAQRLELEIITTNEFHSTRDAEALFPGEDSDAAAAALILQNYLDQQA